MSQITNHSPSIAAGAPTSPRMLALAWALVALVSIGAELLGVDLPVGALDMAALAGALGALVGLWQHGRAQREHAVGAAALDDLPAPVRDQALAGLERAQARKGRRTPKGQRSTKGVPLDAPVRRRTIPPVAPAWIDGDGPLFDDPDPDERRATEGDP